MKFEFSIKTKKIFADNYMDWEDGQNGADCLHHILGRVSNSPYNAAPLSNFRTHWPEWRLSHSLPPIHSFNSRKKYLLKTKGFLDNAGYKPNDYDLAFLEKYKRYYDPLKSQS